MTADPPAAAGLPPDPAAPPPGTAPPTGAARVRLGTAQGWWVVLATVLASAMAFLDSSAVNVALPAIGRDLDASLAGLQWVVNGYTLALASLILLGGALGDRYGRRRVFVVGVAWFAAASLLCGLAQSSGQLIGARVLQGVGGALLTPGSLALIQASFVPGDRARAIGLWSALGGVAGLVGPFLGGFLVDTAGWRWVFGINVPIAAVALLAARHLPESRDPGATGRFDVLGALLGVVALAGTTDALIAAGDDPGGVQVWTAAAVGVAAAAGFVVRERRTAHPVLPPSLFRDRRFTGANLTTLAVYGALGGWSFFLVLELQNVLGYDALQAGAAMLPPTVLLILLSARAGALAQRIGPRRPMAVGPLVAGAGMLLMVRVDAGASYWADVLPGSALVGLGMATLVAPLTATVLAAAPDALAGVASGVNNAVARAAGLLAVAALPVAVGLPSGELPSAAVFTAGFETATAVCAALMAAGGVVAWLTVRDDVLRA